MTGQDDHASSIQLHFCQRCGISIPEADIETGRAKAAPGGYVCVGCIYQARDDEITPKPAGPRVAHTSGSPSSGSKALAAAAILYLVGVTTFLLVKELNRKPPQQQEIVLPPIATAQDIMALSRKVDAIDNQSRKALSQLQSNDNIHREDLSKLNGGLGRIQRRVEEHVALVKNQHKDVIDMIVDISERTVGLDRKAKEILRQISGLERGSGDEPGDPVTKGDKDDKTTKPTVKVVDPEHKKRVDKLIKQMLTKSVDKQERFNATVELADMQDPSSVPALVTALKKDSYDLVRRAAAYSLGLLGKVAATAAPDLIAQMDDKEPHVGYMCERAMGDITKAVLGTTVTFHLDPNMGMKARRAIQAKWEAWYAKNKTKLLPE